MWSYARLVNPNRPDLVGTKLADDYRDAHGKEFRKTFLKGLREQGEAYVTYWYKKAGYKDAKQKLSYFKLYPEWNWVIAKGIYPDDLEKRSFWKKRPLRQADTPV
jgi:two-component system C4-dicarboxylate transport sensor histidine kinase DctB